VKRVQPQDVHCRVKKGSEAVERASVHFVPRDPTAGRA
jgi:hypothetical protein